ncbi:MAG: 1-deoxy-D-xylulose-5-phosphate reductoisomerase [Candidatus Rokubacteria bacterium]|nr:1-deoxy-D-xylulose-5-phosphate reductoisomerase [Candidatus Rokubacteria bacterium]
MKTVTVLGATGSVGHRTLELVAQFPEEFRVGGLAARGSNLAVLAEQIRLHRPEAVALLDPAAVDALARELAPPRPELLGGPEGLVTLASSVEADIVLSALVGGAGLLPTLAAIRAGRTVALANKETLVMAGALMTRAAREHGVALLPVDSEHSAIFQCLAGAKPGEVKRLILTASGGPFAGLSREALEHVTVAQALQHPTWRMGAKITIDSATLMNKGFEIIEAHWLFGLPFDQVDVVVHPQSIVHSMVEFIDGSLLAQLGMPDMGIPILYALSYPRRLPCPAPTLDLVKVGALTFEAPDVSRFPCLRLAREVGMVGGAAPVVLNAANEIAVGAFLDGRCAFMDIPRVIGDALEAHAAATADDLEACLRIDAEVRRWTHAALAVRVPRGTGG